MASLLAEDLLLLLIDDRSGRKDLPTWFIPECVLAGALLAELAMLDRVEPSRGPAQDIRIRVRDSTPTGDRLLDRLLVQLARKQFEPRAVVRRIAWAPGLEKKLTARLVEAGAVQARRHRMFRVRSSGVRYTAHSERRTVLVDSLRSALLGDDEPGLRVSATLSLLDVVDAVPGVLPELAPDALRAYIASVLESASWRWVVEGVRQAIDDIDTVTSYTVT